MTLVAICLVIPQCMRVSGIIDIIGHVTNQLQVVIAIPGLNSQSWDPGLRNL